MSWESPYVRFELQNGRSILWHSDNVESIAKRFGFPNMREMEGRWVYLTGFVRNERMSRVTNIQDL